MHGHMNVKLFKKKLTSCMKYGELSVDLMKVK